MYTTISANMDKLLQEAESLTERRSKDAFPLAQEVALLAEQTGEPLHLAYANYIMAFYKCLVENDYDTAISLCEEVFTKCNPSHISEIAYKIYMVLGNSYQLKGEVFSAQESYMRGLRQLEQDVNVYADRRKKGFLASFYYNVSLLLGTSQLEISSKEYLEKAIQIYTELESFFKLSKSYVAYAGEYEREGNFHKSIEVLFKALEIDERIQDAYSIALTKANLGILHLRISENATAHNYLNDAIRFFESQEMKYEMAMVKVNLGETLFTTGSRAKGIEVLIQAELLFAELENKRELSQCYKLLADFQQQMNNLQSSLAYKDKYIDTLKYFYDVEKTNALARAKKEFESEQREKETLLLREKNEEIKKYVQRLESSNNQLKQFAHVASHDLREPLRMIHSYMALLRKSLNGSITEQQDDFIGFAVDGAKRLDNLIQDLLRLAKVDANPRIENVKLAYVADEVKLNLDALIKEKNAVVVHSSLPEIKADRTMLLQLFQNIIANGIKYNENATPTVRINCQYFERDFCICIADNGIGVPESYRAKVFEIFQRVETVKKYSGSGIGLAICKKIVDSMNGKISISESALGGTCFNITLPNTLLV